MKSIARAFLILPLLLSFSSFCQENKLFYSIEEALKVSPDSVFRLNLSKQKITTIPQEIFRFKNLRELNLEKNKISELPSNFIFEKLETLNLNKNDIEIFPEVICQNTALKQLFLGKNKMTEIPDCIGELSNLVILDIWFNPLTELPESLSKLKKLRVLDIRGVNYSFEFQKKWKEFLPWVKIEFDLGCDCGY